MNASIALKMKRTFPILFFVSILFAPLLLSCKKEKEIKSLTELLREEEKAIDNFIRSNGITVEEAREGQQEFKPDVYYKFRNNLYMCVLDKGGELAIPEKTRVNVRMRGYMFKEKKEFSFDNLSNGGYQDTEFLYVDRYNRGALHFIKLPSAPSSSLNSLMCEGLAFPMSLLGNGAKVRLIIPFSIGPEMNYEAGISMFCEEVRYEFSKF
ncbi:DUF4827 family protein [Porphyromonas circumdentaria]|uniref:DUF4827 domain-containing protein n=1 Tax=Porphyromonas circumdentaria TaxID=29524 RepID=A0A1T4P766_9PORP|nr:DUF4827 family protein [Porphyromonas circumdentaria]MBB6276282.1 hypothetical protein [Porphyromonas circumdentaria]MDO4722997.1 DUF4827 family protein [Porphyromonas circumdentaria]SJZ87430.1 protein of unknown function [Porphyromonas circumdentaria]